MYTSDIFRYKIRRLTPEKIGSKMPVQFLTMVSSMLLHVMIALDESELKAKISKLSVRKDTVVESVENPNAFWKEVPRRTCDLLMLDRGILGDRAL